MDVSVISITCCHILVILISKTILPKLSFWVRFMYFVLSLNECMLYKCICVMLCIQLMIMTVAYLYAEYNYVLWERIRRFTSVKLFELDLCFDFISKVHYNYYYTQCSHA